LLKSLYKQTSITRKLIHNLHSYLKTLNIVQLIVYFFRKIEQNLMSVKYSLTSVIRVGINFFYQMLHVTEYCRSLLTSFNSIGSTLYNIHFCNQLFKLEAYTVYSLLNAPPLINAPPCLFSIENKRLTMTRRSLISQH